MKPREEISSKKKLLNQIVIKDDALNDNKFYGECDLFEIIPDIRSTIDFSPIQFYHS